MKKTIDAKHIEKFNKSVEYHKHAWGGGENVIRRVDFDKAMSELHELVKTHLLDNMHEDIL